jgi:hypothetical protein
MKYLSNQEQWDRTGQSLADIFGVDYTPTTYEPPMVEPLSDSIPWNKGKQGVQPSTRKGTKQGPLSPEHREKIRQGMLNTTNSMHNPIHKANHQESMAKRNTPEWREKLRQAAITRWAKQKAT